MMLLEAQQLTFYVKDRLLIDIDHLHIYTGDRIGLVGQNGSGKTTLLNLLAGKKQGTKQSVVKRHGTCELIPQLKRTDTTDSGGEVTQAYINRALAQHADILLADEPTANLDVAHMERLESQLRRSQDTFVIVSHDRTFLDALCTTIWEIEDGQLNIYKGNYSAYVKQKELKQQQQEQAYEQYEKKKKQLEKALIEKQQKAQQATKVPKHVSPSERRLLGAKTYFANIQKKLHKSAHALETRIEQLDKVEKVQQDQPIKMTLANETAFKNKIILRADRVSGQVGERVLWHPANFNIQGGDKLAIIGPNGSGKTTLIKKILAEDEGLTIALAMKIGYFSQNLERLHVDRTILDNVSTGAIQDESLIRIILARLHFFRDDVYKKVRDLSGGERVKVAFAKLFVSDINTLILDEPTNFLDIATVEVLESLLRDYEGTVIFASHDRQFIQSIATRILTIEDKTMRLFEGTYTEYKNTPLEDTRDTEAEKLLVLETRISEVLSKLSLEPSDALEEEFQALIARKKALEDK